MTPDTYSIEDNTAVEETYELDIIYHNMTSTSNSKTVRALRYTTVKQQLQILAQQIAGGCFDLVVSVAASKQSFVVVMQTARSNDELSRLPD